MEFVAGLLVILLVAYIGYRILKKKKVAPYVPSVPTTPTSPFPYPENPKQDEQVLPGTPQQNEVR